MKIIIRILLIVVIATVLIGILLNFTQPKQGPGLVRISGNIEVTDARLAFRIPGRLEERLVEEGDTVKEGQVLARLDNTLERLAVEQAKTALLLRKAIYEERVNGSRRQEIVLAEIELEQAEIARKVAEAERKRIRSDLERNEKLFLSGNLSDSQYDGIATQLTVAEIALEAADARIEASRQKLSLVREGAREEAREQARIQVMMAEESLRLAEQKLAYTELLAPFPGVVLSTAVERGEYLNPGTAALTLADLDTVWLRAFVSERQLGSIKLGEKVTVKTDAFPDREYKGTVSFINNEAEFTPKQIQTEEERVKLMYRIKIRLENSHRELKPGMPADAILPERVD